MCVHVEPEVTQIAVLEGRSLIEHHVERAEDDANQIDGNIYRGRVKNVLPGMEAAFVDIGTPKNAVLYWGDVQFDRDDVGDREPGATRIEHLLRPGQTILCQVTKNPIGLKGARLTEEVSLPGRFVVLVPNSDASGISKRLDDRERRRLRSILDDIRPEGHGVIVRTAAEGVDVDELRRDVEQLVEKWNEIEEKAKRLPSPVAALLRAAPGAPGDPRGAQRGVPRRRHRRPRAVRPRSRLRRRHRPRARRSRRVLRHLGRGDLRSSSATTCTSSSTRRSTARSGCRRAAR